MARSKQRAQTNIAQLDDVIVFDEAVNFDLAL